MELSLAFKSQTSQATHRYKHWKYLNLLSLPGNQFLAYLSPHQMVPLHIAAKNGWLEIVECLVGKEAESVVNIKDNDGVSVQDYIPQVMLS